ncbi:MAG TPA: hypothetical protein VLJ61_03670 [Pyrinomonadaceae bacterium]|nr:hypothetical protein [Pyrinomonadaceae bacterium]
MRIEIKLSGALYSEMMQDLMRPHPFAAERVGFAFARVTALRDHGSLVLLNRYHSIPDSQYVDDATVGARIGADALTWAMQEVYRGRPAHEGIFHIHLHCHDGQTDMSRTDKHEIPQLIPGFRSVGRNGAHGIIILSLNHAVGWVWLLSAGAPVLATKVMVIGTPIHVFERRDAE